MPQRVRTLPALHIDDLETGLMTTETTDDDLDPELSSETIEELKARQRKINSALRKAERAENDKRTLGDYREHVRDAEKELNELMERQRGYDTRDKAHTFGFGAFDGAGTESGAIVFARVETIYAITKTPDEKFTLLKTMDGPLPVMQSPSEVIDEFTEVRFSMSSERVREMQSELIRREKKVEENDEAQRKALDAAQTAAQRAAGLPTAGPDFRAAERLRDIVGDDLEPDPEPENEEEPF